MANTEEQRLIDDAQKKAWQKTTWENTTALQLVTGSCHALINTHFPTPAEKPAWFDDLVESLNTIKVIAKEWVNEIAPELTATIPNSVLDFNSTFKAVTSQILKIAEAHPTAQGPENPHVKEVVELLDGLKYRINGIIKKIETMEKRLNNWSDKLQKAFDVYKKNAAKIQETHDSLKAECDGLKVQISLLQDNIDTYNTIAIAGFVGEIAGTALMIGGLVACIGSFIAGGLIIALGGLLAISGSVAQREAEAKIKESLDQISDIYAKVNEKERQILAIVQLAENSKAVETNVNACLQAISGVKTMWTAFKGTIQSVVDKLNETDASKPLGHIMNKLAIEDARNQWEEVTITARKIIEMKVTVETKEARIAA